MKTKKQHFGLALGFLALCTILTACKSTNPPPTPPPTLELLFPKGPSGQPFRVGDTVPIRWSIHDTNQVRSVGISYSLDSGKTVTTTQLISDSSFSYPDTAFRWIIKADQHSSQFVVVIWEYSGFCISGSSKCSSPYHDKSAPFVVNE